MITSLLEFQHVFVNVPTPTGGGVVGQTRISDDNSPLPRDRVLFNYDYFDGTPLTPNGLDVHRMEAGFEKTFFDGWTSVELRLPFASSLSSDIASDGVGTQPADGVRRSEPDLQGPGLSQ